MRRLALPLILLALPALAQQTVGIEGQDQACAGEFSMMIDVPMSDIRVNGHDESPAGNTVVFLQTADDTHSANCEADDYGTVIEMLRTGG